MKQYIELLNRIKSHGVQKEQARPGMPTTTSLFGHQMRFDLSKGLPILTTKFVPIKLVVKELLWMLSGDVDVKTLYRQKADFWNEDSYAYYCKVVPTLVEGKDSFINGLRAPLSYKGYIEKLQSIIESGRESEKGYSTIYGVYTWGDCGYQYGKVWRGDGETKDQITSVLNSLKNTPFSRRHIVSAIDPNNDTKLALYWCHALFQFNCRPIQYWNEHPEILRLGLDLRPSEVKQAVRDYKLPLYYLDCQLYQRSADVFLGVPFNITSYCILVNIFSRLLNMVPGEYIHTFGDVHIYSNHEEAIVQLLGNEPLQLPTLNIDSTNWVIPTEFDSESVDRLIESMSVHDFSLEGYKHHGVIEAELSTGIQK